MLEGRRIAVVIPAYNEERWIERTVRTMPAFVDAILVVDDASRDATIHEAERAGDPRLSILRHAENRGVGAAIVTGYQTARRGHDVIAVMAGDGQMHPDDLQAVVAPVAHGEADYVKGDRLAHPDVWRAMPPQRLIGTRVLGWLTGRAAGLPRVSDAQCGYTAISSRATYAIDLDGLWQRYGYCNDLIGAIAEAGLRFREVAVRPIYRGEASGIRPWHALTYAFILGRIAARQQWLSWAPRRQAP